MTVGRKPVPTALKLIRGTDQPSRVNKDEPKPKADKIKMPKGMSKLAQQHWDLVCCQLKDAGIITNLDVTALMLYCESFSLWRDATDKITTHGAVVKGRMDFPVRSPYLIVAQKAFDQMKTMLTEFGMTPSSRAKISTTKEHQIENDPWANI